ncbi:MAG TPA: hypothetical protein GX691_08325 [Clostridia bacterium]|jgi:cell division protein DivIC|nr:hypothetical protein [Clostridia bacterium]
MPRSQHVFDMNNKLTPVTELPIKNRTKKGRLIKIKYGTLICAAVVFCIFWNLIQLHWTIVQLDREIDFYLQEKQQLLSYQEQLQKDMEMVQSGEYIEKLAREQLGMVKPGENLVLTRNNSGDISN